MSNGDDRLIGEIHQMCKSNGQDIRSLFGMVSEMREGRCPQGMALSDRVSTLETCTKRIWLWLLAGVAGGAGGGVGVQKVISAFFGGE